MNVQLVVGYFGLKIKIWLALVCRWYMKPHEQMKAMTHRWYIWSEEGGRLRRGPWETSPYKGQEEGPGQEAARRGLRSRRRTDKYVSASRAERIPERE